MKYLIIQFSTKYSSILLFFGMQCVLFVQNILSQGADLITLFSNQVFVLTDFGSNNAKEKSSVLVSWVDGNKNFGPFINPDIFLQIHHLLFNVSFHLS